MLKRAGQITLWVIVAAFLAGLGRFAFLRFSSGELYPEYSTLRADPLGTKALLESLRGLEKVSVTRHIESLQKLKADPNSTIFFLGTFGLPGASNEMQNVEALARTGARVFVSLNAIRSKNAQRESDRINRWRPSEDKTSEPVAPELKGVRVKLIDPLKANTNRLEALCVSGIGPRSLPWYGRYCFETPANGWETLYEVKEKPVIIQRKTGLRNVVFCADTFLFSNEALARERSPEFLLWAVGASRKIVFDETHLGISRGSSIMVVLREYRLHGLFFGLLAVAALWIWKNGSSFVPAYAETSREPEAVEGKTAREGVVHLLERNLSVDELPAIYLREWGKSHPNPTALEAARLKEAQSALTEYSQLPKKDRDPLDFYERITNILSPSKAQ